MAVSEEAPGSIAFIGWRMVLLCFLSQNLAMGLAYGSFGALLVSNEAHFQVNRATAAVGMSFLTLAVSLLSPLAGGLLQRIPVRTAMMTGAVLSIVGYWGLAFASVFPAALLMYALIGSGVCLLGILGPLVVVNRWFAKDRAKALSLVNLPIMMFATPFLVAELLPQVGRFVVLMGIGSLFVGLLPLLILLVDDPARVGQQARGAGHLDTVQSKATEDVPNRLILKSPAFWLLSLAIGIMAGSGTGFVVHIIAFGGERGMAPQNAAGLLSVFAGAGIAGTLLFGWICDRLGSQVAVLLSALTQALLWAALSQASGQALYIIAAALGLCVVPLITYHGAALSELFGPALASRAMGFSYAMKLPFLFAFAPAIGLLYDSSGSYQLAFLVTAVMLSFAVLTLALMLLITRGRRTPVGVPQVG